MRILFFSNVFPNPLEPHKGTFNLSALRALAEAHAVRVVSPVAWTKELAAFLGGIRGIDRRQPAFLGGPWAEYPRFYYPPKILRTSYEPFLRCSVGRTFRRAAESFRPDAILSYWAHPDGAVATWLARRIGVPSVVMVGGSDVLLLARRGRRRAIVKSLDSADAVITVSRHLADYIVRAGIPHEKVHVVHRGVDRALFRPFSREAARRKLGIDPETKVLVSVGRLVPVKGFSVLIEACRVLREWDERIACYVLGGGPLERALRRQVERNGLDGIVRLCGPQRQQELARWYQAADLAVLPSLSEGIPNVLLEAMACGTPFVGSAVGGVPEIADPHCDRLVPPGDAVKLAEAVRSRLEQRNGVGPRRFEPLSWCESAAGLAAVIEATRSVRTASKREHDLRSAERGAEKLAANL